MSAYNGTITDFHVPPFLNGFIHQRFRAIGIVTESIPGEDTSGMAGNGSKEMGFADTKHVAGHGAGRQSFRIDPRSINLGILLPQDTDDRLDAIKAHGDVSVSALPFHLHDHESLFRGQFREAGRFALRTGVIAVAMEKDDQGNRTRGGILRLLGNVLVPEILVRIFRPGRGIHIHQGILHNIALDPQLVEYGDGDQFKVFHAFRVVDSPAHVESTEEIVIPIVGTQHIIPRLGEEHLQRSLPVRVDDDFLKRVSRSSIARFLIRFRRLCGILPTDECRYRKLADFPGFAIDRNDSGNDSREVRRGQLSIHESCSRTDSYDLDVCRGSSHADQPRKGLQVLILPLVRSGIDDHDPAAVFLDDVVQIQPPGQFKGLFVVQPAVREDIKGRPISGAGMDVALRHHVVIEDGCPLQGRKLIDGTLRAHHPGLGGRKKTNEGEYGRRQQLLLHIS